jgi:type II secretory pathway component PulF
LFLFLELFVVRQMGELFEDFDAELPILTNFFLDLSHYAGWVLFGVVGLLGAGGVALVTLGRFSLVARVQYLVPLLGPLWRYSRLAQVARTVRLLLSEGVPLGAALRTAGAVLPDGFLGGGCRRVAAEVESGRPLSESLDRARAFPTSMVPLVEWGEAHGTLADAFAACAEAFEGRVRSHGALLGSVVLPVALVFVMTFVALMVVALFMPLVSLVQRLT